MPQRLLTNTGQLNKVLDIPLFSALSAQERSGLIEDAEVHGYVRGEYLFHQGSPIKFFYVMFRGLVNETRKSNDGRAFAVSLHKEGDVFSKTDVLLRNDRHATYAVAADTSFVAQLPIGRFMESLQRHEQIAERLLSNLAQFSFMANAGPDCSILDFDATYKKHTGKEIPLQRIIAAAGSGK